MITLGEWYIWAGSLQSGNWYCAYKGNFDLQRLEGGLTASNGYEFLKIAMT